MSVYDTFSFWHEMDDWYGDFTEDELYYEALSNHMEYVDDEETRVCTHDLVTGCGQCGWSGRDVPGL